MYVQFSIMNKYCLTSAKSCLNRRNEATHISQSSRWPTGQMDFSLNCFPALKFQQECLFYFMLFFLFCVFVTLFVFLLYAYGCTYSILFLLKTVCPLGLVAIQSTCLDQRCGCPEQTVSSTGNPTTIFPYKIFFRRCLSTTPRIILGPILQYSHVKTENLTHEMNKSCWYL